MGIEELKAAVCRAIDARREEIVGLAEALRATPELGFKEQRTAALVAERLHGLGIAHETGLALMGVKGRLRGTAAVGARRPTVALMGELDAYLCREHPDAVAETGRCTRAGTTRRWRRCWARRWG